jgi:DNA invertase Pin-like site-specific DNA recombinase
MTAKNYFSYIRVSTIRQGQTGTSLTEQRSAIERYAQRWGLQIIREFEEKETAAKKGRPVFSYMLNALKQGKAQGVIIHKIDRSARNLRDWAEVGELIDQGIEIHFANENLDLYSRGGRLSADIQAVVASDYIRNLREEVKKGFYGRIKQGLYPLPAPVGYIDRGQGQTKEPHPVQGPLVRKAFELYATGKFSIKTLVEKTYELGLRNRKGGKITKNGMNGLLHNLFYIGLIRMRRAREIYPGRHTPLVSKALFDQVQDTLSGKKVDKQHRHFFIFRRLLSCSRCNARLIGEMQKGHVYYRCQTKQCPQKTIREELVDEAFATMLMQLRFNEIEERYFRQEIKDGFQSATAFRETQTKALNLQLDQVRSRLSKLTDAYIDGMLEKEIYLDKKNSLVLEEKGIKERLERLDEGEQKVIRRVEAFLELVNNAYLSYKMANPQEKRELVKIVTSNLYVKDKSLSIELNYPFQVIAERAGVPSGGPQRDTPRNLSVILSQLREYFRNNELHPVREAVAA